MVLTFRALAWGSLVLCLAANAVWIHRSLTSDAMLPWLNGWSFAPVVLFSAVPALFTVTSHMPGPSQQEFAGSPLGLGTLVEVRRTGMTLNEQPQVDLVLDVDTADGSSFQGTARQIVDLIDLAGLAPGAVLPVRYQPGRSDGRVVLAMDAGKDELRRLAQQILFAKGKLTEKQMRISEYGVTATVVVMAMRPTGEVRDGESVLDLDLRVTRADATTFDLTVRKAMGSEAVKEAQQGAVLEVKYLPDDESDLLIIRAPTAG